MFSFKKLTISKEWNGAITTQESVKIIQKSKQAIGVHKFFNMHSYYLPFSLISGCVSLQLKIIAEYKNCIVIIETQTELGDDKTKTSSTAHLGSSECLKYNSSSLQLFLFTLSSLLSLFPTRIHCPMSWLWKLSCGFSLHFFFF